MRSIGAEIARRLNWPWDVGAVEVRSWRLWPFARVWQVTSRVATDGAVVAMRINDRTGAMVFGRVRYPAGGLAAGAESVDSLPRRTGRGE